MLREDRRTDTNRWLWRVLPVVALAALTTAVGSLRGPALAEEKAPAPTLATRPNRPAPLYLRDGKDGVLVIRPAAALRHAGVDRLAALVVSEIGDAFPLNFPAATGEALKVDITRPGFLRLELRNIEWVTANIGFGKSGGEQKLHSVMFLNPVIRTVAPFDWLAFFRQWRCEVTEARTEQGSYHRLKGPLADLFGPHCAVYLPDNRTLVIDDEANIRKLVGVSATTPDYLRGADWAGASEGLLAIAIKNRGDTFTQDYDLGGPDDAQVLTLFKGVDRWIVSVADSDALALTATAACRNQDASETLVRAVNSLLDLARAAVAKPVAQTDGDEPDQAERMARALLDHLGILRGGRFDGFPPIAHLISIRADRCGTLTEWAKLFAESVRDAQGEPPKNARKDATRSGPSIRR